MSGLCHRTVSGEGRMGATAGAVIVPCGVVERSNNRVWWILWWPADASSAPFYVGLGPVLMRFIRQ